MSDTPEQGRKDPVVERVRQRLHERSQMGIAKYGTTLGDNPADTRERLVHLQEELLDAANYVTWQIMKMDGEL